jgi:hypothetical protein
MAPNTRSGSLKFEQTTDGGWRVIEGGTARRLTTEELNEFADNFKEARLENEVLTKEKGELEALMAQKDVQHHEKLQEKERALDAIVVFAMAMTKGGDRLVRRSRVSDGKLSRSRA